MSAPNTPPCVAVIHRADYRSGSLLATTATTATKPAQQGSSSCDSLATSCDKPTESPVDPNLSQRVATLSQALKPAMTGLVAVVAVVASGLIEKCRQSVAGCEVAIGERGVVLMEIPLIPTVAKCAHRRYGLAVAANSATGFGHPTKQKAHKRHQRKAGAFFVPAIRLYGGCVWEAFAPAGFLLPRLTNLHTAATHSFGHERGGSSAKGAVPMKHACNPSTPNSHADAYKAMALAALRADSSLSVRLARYNSHMAKARTLEAQGVAK